MKKKKIMKIVGISVIYLVASAITLADPELFNFKSINIAITFIGLIAAYIQILYKESLSVFLFWRKFCSKFNRDTVVWNSSSKYTFSNELEFKHLDKISRTFRTIPNVVVSSERNTSDSIELQLTYENVLHTVNLSLINYDEYSNLIINYNTSVSYPNSKNEFNKYINFTDVIKRELRELSNSGELHSIDITFTKSNPFYKFIVNHIDESKNAKFHLQFKEDENDIHIYNNKIKVTSKSTLYIRKVLENYIVVS